MVNERLRQQLIQQKRLIEHDFKNAVIDPWDYDLHMAKIDDQLKALAEAEEKKDG